jgi:hypothetical protein
LRDCDEHPAEIDAVHQQSRHHAVPGLGAIRQPHTGDPDENNVQQDHERHAHGEEGQRLDIGQAIFGADKAGAPEKHKNQGRRGKGRVAWAHW